MMNNKMYQIEIKLSGRESLEWENYGNISTNLGFLQQVTRVLMGNSNVLGIRIRSYELKSLGYFEEYIRNSAVQENVK